MDQFETLDVVAYLVLSLQQKEMQAISKYVQLVLCQKLLLKSSCSALTLE